LSSSTIFENRGFFGDREFYSANILLRPSRFKKYVNQIKTLTEFGYKFVVRNVLPCRYIVAYIQKVAKKITVIFFKYGFLSEIIIMLYNWTSILCPQHISDPVCFSWLHGKCWFVQMAYTWKTGLWFA